MEHLREFKGEKEMGVEIVEEVESPEVQLNAVTSDPTPMRGKGRCKSWENGAPISASLGAMRALVGKLDMLLLDDSSPQGCSAKIKDGMGLLKDDVEEISSYLDELSEVENPPQMAKCWMNEACDLCYDMEDYIDSLLSMRPPNPTLIGDHVMISRSVRQLFNHVITIIENKKHVNTLKRHKWDEQTAATVSEFRIYAQEAIERHKVYGINSFSTLKRRFVSIGPMLPTPYEGTADIVTDGRMRKFINSVVNDEDQQLKVLSVFGSACIGKTTLARELYRKFGKQYYFRAFVRISKKPDMKRIFSDMLSQLQRQHAPQDSKEVDLIERIKEYLQDKRYFIIIDDVWGASVWDIINHAFPKDSHGSRIITTTQIEDVALACCSYQSEHVFEMKPLDDDHSRKLLFNRIFDSESYCPEQSKDVLNEIVEVCSGLPLATISIASLLASHPVISIDLLTYIHHSLSSCLWASSTSERMRQVLNLSYNNLPHYLKTCLLYVSMHPVGYTFCKDDLLKQWVAEGLVDTTQGQDVKRVAETYLDQLIGRRFIQPICTNFNNEVVSCAVHDAVHDLIARKSAEENFIVAIDYSSRKNVALSRKARRLSLLFGDARYAKTPANIRKSQVRSLFYSGLFDCMPCIREFKVLRVLNLQLSSPGRDSSPVDLTGISQLFHLRYLKISCDVCIELPEHMRGLQCLETLDIKDARVTGVPWINLPNLLHLSLPIGRNLLVWVVSTGSFRLNSLGKLNYLQDLHIVIPSTPHSDDLERNFKAMGYYLIRGHVNLKTFVMARCSSVKKKTVRGASELVISWNDLTPPPSLERFECSLRGSILLYDIPTWVGKLHNLGILKIAVRGLRMSCVRMLRGLPALAVLSLYVRWAPAERIIFDKAGFSVLKYLKLGFTIGIARLKFEADAMPNLLKLNLGFNDNPRMDQHQQGTAVISIEHMPSLREISAKVGSAAADQEYFLRSFVTNHPSNPRIIMQSVDYNFYGDESTKQKKQPDEILEVEPSGSNKQPDEIVAEEPSGSNKQPDGILKKEPDERDKILERLADRSRRVSRSSKSSWGLHFPGMALKKGFEYFGWGQDKEPSHPRKDKTRMGSYAILPP